MIATNKIGEIRNQFSPLRLFTFFIIDCHREEMKDWKLPPVGTMLLVYVLILAIFDEPDQPVETPFDESLSASEESKKLKKQIEERHRANTTEIFNKTMARFQNEVQVVYVLNRKHHLVEWTLMVGGRVYLHSDWSVAEYYNVEKSIRRKTWNGFAMAMSSTLHSIGYVYDGDRRLHTVWIFDYSTFKITEGDSRKSSLGICDCQTRQL